MKLTGSALPILRELGSQGGDGAFGSPDASMVKIWLGLELREFFQASMHEVSSRNLSMLIKAG